MGILAALGVTLFWAAIFNKIRITLVDWLVIIAILGMLVGLLLPAGQAARENARQASCANHLLNISKAIQSYEAKRGSLPSVNGLGESGAPPMSWRVAILPQLDRQTTFGAYRPEEPWNSPHNILISQRPFEIYACPSDPPVSLSAPHTNYFAVIGSQTAWPADRSRTLSEIKDDPTQTIMLIEAPERNAPADAATTIAGASLTPPQ
jgi:competence protein ComGC